MMETGGDRVAPGRSAIAWANPRQHPLGEKPSISVMLADPRSVEGIGGGQMLESVLGAAAVVLADCVEVSGPSPGSDPTAVLLRAVVWPFTCAAVGRCHAKKDDRHKDRALHFAFSCFETIVGHAVHSRWKTTREPSKNENEVQERSAAETARCVSKDFFRR
jgi:hypothetical protein